MEPDRDDDSGDSGVVGDGHNGDGMVGCVSPPKIESKDGGLADWCKELIATDTSSREVFSEEPLESVSC